MLWFVIGLVGFLGLHSISIVSRGGRNGLAERLGEGPYKGIYSVLSLVTFGLMVWGYGLARPTALILYTPPVFMRHLVWLLMAPVFVLLVATYAPGKIKSTVKHPLLTAVKTWALAHLLANGSVVDLMLFGGFLAWAVADRISLKRRPDAKVPEKRGWGIGDAVAIVLGLGLYAGFFLYLHELIIGVPVR